MILGGVFLALAVVVALGTWVYLRRAEGKGNGRQVKRESGNSTGKGGRKAKKPERHSLPPFLKAVKDVKEGVLILEHERYRMICRLEAPDYYLLGVEGQDLLERAVAGALRQLSYPIQTIATGTPADTGTEIEALRERAKTLPPVLAEMALTRAAYLEALGRGNEAVAWQAYLVIPYNAQAGAEWDTVKGELLARTAQLQAALAGEKIRLTPLSSAGVLELLRHFLRRGDSMRPEEVVRAGVRELYSIWEKEAV